MRKIIATFWALAACGTTTAVAPILTVQTERTQYAPGDSLALRLSSLADTPLLYSGCAVQVQRFENTGWKAPPTQQATLCALALSVLNPGATQVEYVALSNALVPGTYRVVLEMVFGEDGHSLLPVDTRISNPFRIP